MFAVLSDASKHALIDGSGMVRAAGAQQLELGSVFEVPMKMGMIRYRARNRVVEFESNRRVAWSNVNRAIWRYELEPSDGGTRVTETYVWGTSPFWPLLRLGGWTSRMRGAMERTLERLEKLVV